MTRPSRPPCRLHETVIRAAVSCSHIGYAVGAVRTRVRRHRSRPRVVSNRSLEASPFLPTDAVSFMSRTTEADYSRRYYAHYSDTDEAYEWDSPGWRRWFLMAARNTPAITGPIGTALDVGCAGGLLVQALVHEGVDASGFGISPTAIDAAHADVRDRVRVGSETDAIEGRHDLITCIEALEHLSPDDTAIAIAHVCAVTDPLLMSSTPGDFDEPTHVNAHPLADWATASVRRRDLHAAQHRGTVLQWVQTVAW